jgi:hypothetical protein
MNNKKLFLKTDKIGFVLGVMLLAALAESTGYAGGLSVGINLAPVVVAPPVVVVAPPVVVLQDDYVYYPNYGVYYSSGRHQYAYLEGGAWVWAPAPSGVSVDILMASPSVRMDWHDSPEKHHAEMMQKYPKDWKPSAENQDLKQDRKDAAPDHDKKPPGQ